MKGKRVDAKKIIALIIILIAAILIFFLTQPKNCKSDDSCFDAAALKCSKAEVITMNNNNTYTYEILGKKSGSCIINIKMNKLSDSQPIELKNTLEGREMKCAVPLEMLQTQNIKQITNLNDYCTGPLKEAILEITIDKMYEIIVKNIGPIASRMDELTKAA